MITIWLSALPVLLLIAAVGWFYAYRQRNVNIVDSLWPMFFLVAALIYALQSSKLPGSAMLLLILVTLWSLRLGLYLTHRNTGKAEDHRYQTMRERPGNFAVRSLITVFGLQAVLAWLISVPLLAAIVEPATFSIWLLLALSLFVIGFFFEAAGDWQLARFRADPANKARVLDTGVWRYSRHPNYFGEACIWWSFFLFALAGGHLWTIVSPIAMTLLLLKISGVSLLEKDISERRPAYREYMQTTSAFFPWMPGSRGKTS